MDDKYVLVVSNTPPDASVPVEELILKNTVLSGAMIMIIGRKAKQAGMELDGDYPPAFKTMVCGRPVHVATSRLDPKKRMYLIKVAGLDDDITELYRKAIKRGG